MAYSIRRVAGVGKEERLAEKMNVMVSDLNLDLEQVGIMVARVLPELTFNRLMVVLESAQAERTKVKDEPKMYHDYRNWRMEDE
jgi:uncharacterized paraquat-inducible protein A